MSERPAKKQRWDRMRLRLLTFNVQAYQTAKTGAKRERMRVLLESSNADIIALQEDLQSRPAGVMPSFYTVVAQCRAERTANGYLYNTILAHDRVLDLVREHPQQPVDLQGEQAPARTCLDAAVPTSAVPHVW